MQHGIILEIQGFGVLAQAPSTLTQSGYAIRWSSDPDTPPDAPVHVLKGHDEVKRFLELGVDRRFVKSEFIRLIPAQLEEGSNRVSREEAVRLGVSEELLNTVRAALVISGNSAQGPVMDEIEWVGTRSEYAEGTHMREAFLHAQQRGIKSPAIFPHTDRGHLLRASTFMENFITSYRPSLLAAELVRKVLDTNLAKLDVSSIHPERAKQYLGEIKRAVMDWQQQQEYNLPSVKENFTEMKKAQDQLEAMPPAQSPTAPKSKGPTLN